MSAIRLIVCVVMAVLRGVGGEEIPLSIQRGEWGVKLNGMVLWHLANWPQAAVPLPDQVWADLPRRVVPIQISLDAANGKVRDGSWIPFVQSQVSSLEDVVLCVYGDKKGDLDYTEFEPTPTPDQEAWCHGLVDRWLIPLPDGYVQAGLAAGHISAWNKWYWGNSSRIHVVRGAAPKVGSGGPSDHVYWYDRAMSDEDMLVEVAGASEKLEIRKEFGQYVCLYPEWGDQSLRAEVAWPSGQFLVRLSVPRVLYKAEVTAYLEKYPSSWKNQIEYDPQRLMLQVLNKAIADMSKHIDGPLESLRYSFRTYPFDDACRRAWNILPSNDRYQRHRDAVEAIRNDWAKTPANQIKLSDYHDAMLVYRREVIAGIIAERDRIAKEGVERKEK